MSSQERRPLRWRIAARFGGRRGRNAILASGAIVVLAAVWLMMFRSYEGRPLEYNDDNQTVRQTEVVCPPARTALTADYNPTDPSTPVETRLCVDTGRAKAFTTFLFAAFVAAAAFGLSRLPDPAKESVETTAWDDAIAKVRHRQSEDRPRSSA